jgi:hypothetical protein
MSKLINKCKIYSFFAVNEKLEIALLGIYFNHRKFQRFIGAKLWFE